MHSVKVNRIRREDSQLYKLGRYPDVGLLSQAPIGRADLQEAADLLCELQQAFLSLMQGTGDGHCQPLPDGLSIALIE